MSEVGVCISKAGMGLNDLLAARLTFQIMKGALDFSINQVFLCKALTRDLLFLDIPEGPQQDIWSLLILW